MKRILVNWFYFLTGIIFLVLAKCKHLLQGYSSPKPFPITEIDRCIDYDLHVVEGWLAKLNEYASSSGSTALKNKRILELGPGSDLGVGLYLLSLGAREYNAVDVNNLVDSVPYAFYEALFERLETLGTEIDIEILRDELAKTISGKNGRLNYFCREDFDINAALGEREIDTIFSQAAFEHFDDIDSTIGSVSRLARNGSIAVILIDLQTHSRWIRDKDPNNIYRYPGWLYNLFYFRGIPNRVRPYEYKRAFERHGWGNITISSESFLPQNRHHLLKHHLAKKFIDDKNQMDYMSVWLCATKL